MDAGFPGSGSWRHLFRELEARGGSKVAPDPRNPGQRPIQAAVDLWRKDGLQPSTIQTYLSLLRGLAGWLGKPGFIRRYLGAVPHKKKGGTLGGAGGGAADGDAAA